MSSKPHLDVYPREELEQVVYCNSVLCPNVQFYQVYSGAIVCVLHDIAMLNDSLSSHVLSSGYFISIVARSSMHNTDPWSEAW